MGRSEERAVVSCQQATSTYTAHVGDSGIPRVSLCCSVACHPSKPEVACGFQSGMLRIFDISSAALVQESRQHSGAVTRLLYARNGRLLLSLGETPACRCADVHRGLC